MTLVRDLRPLLAGLALLIAVAVPARAQTEPLASWNVGPTRDAIVDFVARVTTAGSRQYVAPADRIAVFDDNGTLWAEKPYPPEMAFSIDRVRTLALVHPEWTTTEPFASILRGDIDGAIAQGNEALVEVMAATHSGMTTTEFATQISDWLATARNPQKDRPYTELTYQPMLELLDYLRASGFTIYISSGGSTQFTRIAAKKLFGVPPQNVIGTEGALKFQFDDGDPVFERLPKVDFVNFGPGKPVGLENHIGRRPIFAFGNSDSDLEMMQYVCVEPGPVFCGMLHHTDGLHDWDYDRKSLIGQFDKALDAANANGWTIVDISRDWSEIFPPAP